MEFAQSSYLASSWAACGMRGGGWAKDLYIADWDQIDGVDRIHQIYPRRAHYKEVFATKDKKGDLILPLMQGNLHQPEMTEKDIKEKRSTKRKRKRGRRGRCRKARRTSTRATLRGTNSSWGAGFPDDHQSGSCASSYDTMHKIIYAR